MILEWLFVVSRGSGSCCSVSGVKRRAATSSSAHWKGVTIGRILMLRLDLRLQMQTIYTRRILSRGSSTGEKSSSAWHSYGTWVTLRNEVQTPFPKQAILLSDNDDSYLPWILKIDYTLRINHHIRIVIMNGSLFAIQHSVSHLHHCDSVFQWNSILVVVAVDWNPGSLSVPGLTKDGCQLTPLGPTSFSKFVGHRFLHEQELKNYVVATMVGVVPCL